MRLPRLSLLTGLVFLPAVAAQLAPASRPAADRPADSEIVKLSVFEVTAANDDEYRAANTTTGTRYDTPIKDLPMNIEVLTTAFMRDIGAIDVREALEYVSGVQLDTTTAINGSRDNPENTTMMIRGISSGLAKDGFRRFVATDPITVSRVDILKGPGGPLYGQGATGGIINMSSVLAGERPVATVGATIGSSHLRRVEFLWSNRFGPGGMIGLAVPAAYSMNRSSVMYFESNALAMNPALTVRLGPQTSLLVSLESRFNFRDNIRGFFLTDNARAPDGSFYGTFIAGRPGTNRVFTTPHQRDFRFEGPDTFRKERTYVRTYRLDHRFSDRLQWWGGYSAEDINVRERSFNVSLRNANDASIPLKIRTDPRFLALLRPQFGTGQPQVLDVRPNNIINSSRTVRPTWKSELYYAFDTGPVRHRLITGVSYGPLRSGNNAPNQVFYYGNTGNANDPVTRMWEALPAEAILSRFRSPMDYTSVRRWDDASFDQYPQGAESAYGTPASYLTSLFWDRNLYFNLQSSFFRNRFQTIIGFFDTRNDRAGIVYDANGRFLWDWVPPAGSPSGTLAGVRRPEPVRNQAPSITAIWLPIDAVRIYANAMSAIDPGPAYSAYDGNGNPLTAPVVSNLEAGLRLDLLGKKLLVNLVGYRMTDTDRPVNFAAAIQNRLVSPTGTNNSSGFSAFVNTTQKSDGYDVKVDYIPLRALRFNLGLTHTNVRITEIAPYVEPANPDPVRLAAQLRYLAAGGSSNAYLGRPSTDISKYTGAGFVRYEFQSGPLKKLWLMFGSKYLGRREAELISVNTTTGDITVDRRLVPARYLYDFNCGYSRKVDRWNTSLQLNVANLADDDKFYGATWQVGRTYRVTAKVNF